MRVSFILLLIFFAKMNSAQECKIDLQSLAQPDYNMVRLNKFGQNRQFTIVLSRGFDTIANKDIVNDLSQWFLNQDGDINIVNEGDVKKLEDSCHYLVIGLTGQLDDLSIFDLSVKISHNKCTLGTIELTEENDAIIAVNERANCVAAIGNSYSALRNISSGRFLGLYDYYILKDDKMRYLGNLKDDRFNSDSLVDLALIRKENYVQKIDNKYVEACFSCKYEKISQFQDSIDALVDVFDEFCRLYKIGRPPQKLIFYVHSDQSEINLVCGDPKPGTTGGIVIDGLIHTVGLDKELLIHEGIHFIFNSNSGSPNAFFREGIPGSFALFQHPGRMKDECNLIRDDLDIADLITGKTGFWNGPYKYGQCLSYPISGLLVKFLLDEYGIDKLKRFYQYPDAAEGLKAVYNLEINKIVLDWTSYILKFC